MARKLTWKQDDLGAYWTQLAVRLRHRVLVPLVPRTEMEAE